MRKMMNIWIIIIVLLLSGCMNPSHESEKTQEDRKNLKQVQYKTQLNDGQNVPIAENKSPSKDYYQSDERGIATDGTEENFFATEETREIAQLLAKRTDIRQSQVVSLKDRVVITLMTNTNKMSNQTISSIKEDVQKMVPTKQVLIYTDEYHWNRMKDLDASLQQRKAGKSVEEFVEEYFNINIKD